MKKEGFEKNHLVLNIGGNKELLQFSDTSWSKRLVDKSEMKKNEATSTVPCKHVSTFVTGVVFPCFAWQSFVLQFQNGTLKENWCKQQIQQLAKTSRSVLKDSHQPKVMMQWWDTTLTFLQFLLKAVSEGQIKWVKSNQEYLLWRTH